MIERAGVMLIPQDTEAIVHLCRLVAERVDGVPLAAALVERIRSRHDRH